MAESGAFSTRQRVLHAGETELSLNNWIESLLFQISNEPKFSRFIEDLDAWGADTENNGGFIADVAEVNDKKMTAQKGYQSKSTSWVHCNSFSSSVC